MKSILFALPILMLASLQVSAEETALEACIRYNKKDPSVCTQSQRFHVDTQAQLDAAWNKVHPGVPVPHNLVIPKENQAQKEYDRIMGTNKSADRKADDTPKETHPIKLGKGNDEKIEHTAIAPVEPPKDSAPVPVELKKKKKAAAKKAESKPAPVAKAAAPVKAAAPTVAAKKAESKPAPVAKAVVPAKPKPAKKAKKQEPDSFKLSKPDPVVTAAKESVSPKHDEVAEKLKDDGGKRIEAAVSPPAKTKALSINEAEAACLKSGVNPADCKSGFVSSPDPMVKAALEKDLAERCMKFESGLSAQFSTANLACDKETSGTYAQCFEKLRSHASSSGKVDNSAAIIEAKNKLIRSALDEYEFGDLEKLKVQVRKEESNESTAKLSLIDSLQRLHDLDKNEVIKACRDEKCKIDAYNSQLRYLRSEIEAKLKLSKFLTHKTEKDQDTEKRFFSFNAKQTIFNACSEIPVGDSARVGSSQAFNASLFISDLKKWNGQMDPDAVGPKGEKLYSKTDEGINKNTCCKGDTKSFWCSDVGNLVVQSALHNQAAQVKKETAVPAPPPALPPPFEDGPKGSH